MFLLKVEPWEQPTKKSTLVFEKLNSKYVKVNLIDKNDCSDDDDEGGEPVLAERFRCRTITEKLTLSSGRRERETHMLSMPLTFVRMEN